MSNSDQLKDVAQLLAKEGLKVASRFATRAAEVALDVLAALAPEPEEIPPEDSSRSPWDDKAWSTAPADEPASAPVEVTPMATAPAA